MCHNVMVGACEPRGGHDGIALARNVLPVDPRMTQRAQTERPCCNVGEVIRRARSGHSSFPS
jgi:hypothetical protein